MQRLIELRKENPTFCGGETEVIDTGNPGFLGYVRQHEGPRIVVLGSFTEPEQRIAANELRQHGLGYAFVDLVNGTTHSATDHLFLEPLGSIWLTGV